MKVFILLFTVSLTGFSLKIIENHVLSNLVPLCCWPQGGSSWDAQSPCSALGVVVLLYVVCRRTHVLCLQRAFLKNRRAFNKLSLQSSTISRTHDLVTYFRNFTALSIRVVKSTVLFCFLMETWKHMTDILASEVRPLCTFETTVSVSGVFLLLWGMMSMITFVQLPLWHS